MNILYIAYSCSPNYGSEDRIGWKIPMAAAVAGHRVFVLTKEEHRLQINAHQKAHSSCPVQFYYVDIPLVYKKIFRGFAYSGRLNIWHRRALAEAAELCCREKIDIIHQITPVEFRSIGDYGKIPGVKFLCGPIGGGEYIPKGLLYYARKHVLEEFLRSGMNRFAMMNLQRSNVLSHCDAVLFANRETMHYLESSVPPDRICGCMTEIGIDSSEIGRDDRRDMPNKRQNFLVAGRLIYRKGHEFLMDALKELPTELDYTCTILGDGPEENRLKKKCVELGLGHRVNFIGRIPFEEMDKIYANTHVLIMPSVRETTGSVLLEAMARGIPVITIGQFGGSCLLTEEAGWPYYGKSRKEYINSLKNILLECIREPELVTAKGLRSKQLCDLHTWDNKFACYQRIYEKMIPYSEE